MEFTVEASHFRAAVKRMAAIVNPKQERFRRVHIEAKEAGQSTVVLTGTDLSITGQTVIPAEVKRPGVALVDLAKLAVGDSDEPVVVVADDSTVTFRQGSCTHQRGTADASTFPLPEPVSGSFVALSPQSFVEALKVVGSATGDYTKFQLSGVQWHFTKDHLRLAATDAVRLIVAHSPPIHCDKEVTSLLPERSVSILSLWLRDAETVELLPTEQQMVVRTDDGTLIIRCLEGKFPPIDQVIKSCKSPVSSLELDSDDIRAAAKAMSVIKHQAIVCRLMDCDLHFTVTSDDGQIITTQINALSVDGELSWECKLNSTHFHSLLRVMPTSILQWHFISNHKPIRLSCALGEYRIDAYQMPMS